MASSARRRLRASQTSTPPQVQQADIIKDFKRAWEAKDVSALIGLLDPNATTIADGGGLAVAALHPVEGGEHIARYLVDLMASAPAELTLLERTVNGEPGLVAQQDGRIVSVFAFQLEGDRIKNMWAVRNPDKLQLWTAS